MRAEVRPEALCHVVERSGSMCAKQVVKNEQGEEVRGLVYVECRQSLSQNCVATENYICC